MNGRSGSSRSSSGRSGGSGRSGRSGGSKGRPNKPRFGSSNRFSFSKPKCRFCSDKVTEIDYKDVNRLKRFVTEKGKMIPSRVTGTCTKHQRRLSNAIKKARFVALLPHVGD